MLTCSALIQEIGFPRCFWYAPDQQPSGFCLRCFFRSTMELLGDWGLPKPAPAEKKEAKKPKTLGRLKGHCEKKTVWSHPEAWNISKEAPYILLFWRRNPSFKECHSFCPPRFIRDWVFKVVGLEFLNQFRDIPHTKSLHRDIFIQDFPS